MSLSEAPKSTPVVHHFYPIHPQTALQQQSAVYSTSDNPLVAPILSTPSKPSQKVQTRNHKKRKIQQVDSDIEYLGSRPVRVIPLLVATQAEVFVGHIFSQEAILDQHGTGSNVKMIFRMRYLTLL